MDAKQRKLYNMANTVRVTMSTILAFEKAHIHARRKVVHPVLSSIEGSVVFSSLDSSPPRTVGLSLSGSLVYVESN